MMRCLRASLSFANREVRADRCLGARHQAAIDGDAHEGRDDALRHGLDVGGTSRARAVEVALEHDLAAPAREQAVQTGRSPAAFTAPANRSSCAAAACATKVSASHASTKILATTP